MLQTYKPKTKLLQKYIDFFYVFNSERPENVSYIAFPHVNTAISFFKRVNIHRGNYTINITATNKSKTKCSIEILGKYTQPLFVNYAGNCEEIAVVFKPLGINHFFQNDLIELAPLFSQQLNNSIWTEFSLSLFNDNSMANKIEIMENFLVKNLKEKEYKRLYDALKYLEDFETDYSVDKIATLCGFTLKTFQRNFIKHLTCSPSEYKRIARFRHSLQIKLIAKELKTLTRVSYESNYYDQSYFIREFKKMTQLNPKLFFDGITALDGKNIIWRVR